MINSEKPDLVFLDVQMPGMDGFEVLQNLEHQPFVIFSTAYDKYAIQAFEENAVDYLLKPLDSERFDKAINRVKDRIEKKEGNIDKIIELISKKDEGFSKHLFVQKSEKYLNIPVTDVFVFRGLRRLYSKYQL